MSEEIEVLAGVISRPHGVRGEVVVDLHTDEPARRFAKGAKLRCGKKTHLTVAGAKTISGRFVASFAEISDRNQAEELRGSRLWALVPAEDSPEQEDEFYDRQIIGCQVFDHTGALRGEVVEVLHPGAQDLLVVKVGDQERLVPFVKALVPVVEPDQRRVQIAAVTGLLADEDEN